MPGCAFIQCTNHSRTKSKSVGITFHAFPQDGLCKHEWVEVVRSQRREPDWTPTEHSRICSDHFRLGDIYKTGKGLMRIKKEAVPYFQDKLTRDTFTGPSSPNSLDNEDISDLKPIFDSPRISFLKGRIRKLLNSKKKLIRDNKNLKVRNKRLAAKCKSLEDLVLRLEALVKSGGNQQELPSPNQEQQ